MNKYYFGDVLYSSEPVVFYNVHVLTSCSRGPAEILCYFSGPSLGSLSVVRVVGHPVDMIHACSLYTADAHVGIGYTYIYIFSFSWKFKHHIRW